MTTPVEEMSFKDVCLEIEMATVKWLALHTGWDKPMAPYLDLSTLARDSKQNRDKAAQYFQRLFEQEWEPIRNPPLEGRNGGYPGSDAHWWVFCLVCAWEGPMFNSHMRRGRRHRGCTRTVVQPSAELLYVRLRVAVNRCNGKGALGAFLGECADSLKAAMRAGDEDARDACMRSALTHLRRADEYVHPGRS
ncbi:hypothetical protein [Streptomyces albogriseolus]|uniref:hypothetical protein n=1 Tax=Streptomyces albogriseolus TaxID=1887 RepID=UPI00346023C0